MRCALPHAEWIAGDGPYALIAWCGTPTVTLHQTEAAAQAAKDLLDDIGCGGALRAGARHEEGRNRGDEGEPADTWRLVPAVHGFALCSRSLSS